MKHCHANACSPLFQPATAGGVAFLQPRLLGYSAQEGAPSHSVAEHEAQNQEPLSAAERFRLLSAQVQQADAALSDAMTELSNPDLPPQAMERLLQAGVPLVEYTDTLGAVHLGVLRTTNTGELAYLDVAALLNTAEEQQAISADSLASIKPYRAKDFSPNEADSFNLSYQGALDIVQSVSSPS